MFIKCCSQNIDVRSDIEPLYGQTAEGIKRNRRVARAGDTSQSVLI